MPNALLKALQTHGSHFYTLQFLKIMLPFSLKTHALSCPGAPLLERGRPSMGRDPPASEAYAPVGIASHTLSRLKHSQKTLLGPGLSQHAPDRQAADPGCAPWAAPGAARLTTAKKGASLERAPSHETGETPGLGLTLPPTCCVTLDKSLALSGCHSPCW